jgi:type II secretory ATPase GspE/PulE/Tfp pilus assembly ATPase PilB-like protein
MGVPYVRLRGTEVPEDLKELLSAPIAHHYHCLPLERNNGALEVAIADPLDLRTLDNLKALVGLPIIPKLAQDGEIRNALQRCYGIGADTVEDMSVEPRDARQVSQAEVVDDLSGEASVSHLVNQILSEASRSRTTDVHLEPGIGVIRLRYRIDGVLYNQRVPPRNYPPPRGNCIAHQNSGRAQYCRKTLAPGWAFYDTG